MGTRKSPRAPKDSEQEWRELVLAYARQCEDLGVRVVDLLNRTIMAERDLRWYEEREGLSAERDEDIPALLAKAPRAIRSPRLLYRLEWLRVPFQMKGRHGLLAMKGRPKLDADDRVKRARKILRKAGNALAGPRLLPGHGPRAVRRREVDHVALYESARMSTVRRECPGLTSGELETEQARRIEAAGFSSLASLRAARNRVIRAKGQKKPKL